LYYHKHTFNERQRRACIIDDDNNLLLAGAGTGKTSVMVAKAGYLIKSEQAQPKELLLLAFGAKAANEFDERLTKKLNTTDIRASTFHGLELKIIAKVEGKTPDLSVFAEDEDAKAKWVQNCIEQQIYIEYYGIDEKGNTAPYIDRASYHRSISWKRKVHGKYNTGYIELFYSQHQSGDLLSALKYKLGEHSYIAQQLPDQAILSTLREMGRFTELAKLFAQMIGLYKAACFDDKSEQSVIENAKDINQTTKAFELLKHFNRGVAHLSYDPALVNASG
jgi:superfamily I DNA/RNA helicase